MYRTDERDRHPELAAGSVSAQRACAPRLGRRPALPLLALLGLLGPGLVVMLADTDAGSLITAAQSGARFRFSMILPELALIPVLYVVQELTVRLGIFTGEGHGALIRRHFGRLPALVSATTLFLSALGALVTELAGIAGVGQLAGVPRTLSVPAATVFLLALAFSGSYRRLERIAIAIGLAELAFIPAMLLAHPSASALASGAVHLPLGSGSFLLLLAANVGAVIMPWMIFFQQGAVIDRGLGRAALRAARLDTALGALVTQIVMIAVVVALAATVGGAHGHASLSTVGGIAGALTPYLGAIGGRVLFGAGMLGAALIAALVASLAAAWGLAEVCGWPCSLNERPCAKNWRFYLTYGAAHLVGATLVLASVDLISLAVDAEVMNALLLPIVLGFLLALERRALRADQRRRGWRRAAALALCMPVVGFSLYMGASLLLG
ncbi:MAG TPA: divalent metal cation transporter [Solirubrobacteraceae bacterium]|nr:divalent metal cation transporter [Solirubrobacteraceae bacterium]